MNFEERLKRKNEFDGELLYGARQFNLLTGRDEHLKQRDRGWDPFTWDSLKARPCPACLKFKAGKVLFVKEEFDYLRCSNCGMVYISPSLNETVLYNFYSKEDSYSKVLNNKVQMELDWKKFEYGLDLIEEYIKKRDWLLDIGCGDGLFLEAARERGWMVRGEEINRGCLKRLEEKAIVVMETPVSEARLHYDCITLWTVLEHINDPRKLLMEIHRALKPGGVLLILVPNVDSLANRILHEKSTTFSPTHVNLFSHETLTRLLREVGFKFKLSETVWTRLGAINNYLNYEDPEFGAGEDVLKYMTPEAIHEQMLGYLLLNISVRKE